MEIVASAVAKMRIGSFPVKFVQGSKFTLARESHTGQHDRPSDVERWALVVWWRGGPRFFVFKDPKHSTWIC